MGPPEGQNLRVGRASGRKYLLSGRGKPPKVYPCLSMPESSALNTPRPGRGRRLRGWEGCRRSGYEMYVWPPGDQVGRSCLSSLVVSNLREESALAQASALPAAEEKKTTYQMKKKKEPVTDEPRTCLSIPIPPRPSSTRDSAHSQEARSPFRRDGSRP